MKKLVIILLLLIPVLIFGQSKTIHKREVVWEKGGYLGDSITGSDRAKLDSFILSLTDTAFYSRGRRIAVGLSATGGGSVAWGNTIIVATSGGDFTTVQAAITAANAWDVIIVHPGTYNEKLTIDKNIGINLQPGTVLDYTVNDASYGITVNSGVTAYIRGGILRRTAAAHGRVIKNAGTLYVTADIENSTSSITYLIDNNVSGELYIENDFTGNTGYSSNNRCYLDGKVNIDTKIGSFNWMVDSLADVYIEADKMLIDSTRQQISYVQGGSNLSMNINLTRLILYDGVEVEGYAGQNVRDSSDFYFTGNYNFSSSAGKSGKFILHDAYCLEGIPRIGIPNDADSNCQIHLSSCYLKWIYPDRMPDGLVPPTGQHYFENASDTSRAIMRIDNCYLQWSEPVTMGESSRELGNIFYWNGGEFYMANSTVVDYNDDYLGYGNLATLVTSQKIRIYNTQYIFYGHQPGPMFTMLDRELGSSYWDMEFRNCHFARRESDYTGTFFQFSWQARTPNDSDHIVFQNCTFEDDSADVIKIFGFGDGGGGTIPFNEFLDVIEGNIAVDQYIPKQKTGDMRMVGPGHFSNYKESFGYRVKMNDWATYESVSVEDTVDMIITWKEEMGAAYDGEIPRRNWMDLDIKLMIRDSSLVDAPYYYRYYDIRAFAVQPGDGLEVMVDTSVFDFQAGLAGNPGISWSTSQAGDDQYISFEIINRDPTYAITLDAWIKQSLNNESIEFIEPYVE